MTAKFCVTTYHNEPDDCRGLAVDSVEYPNNFYAYTVEHYLDVPRIRFDISSLPVTVKDAKQFAEALTILCVDIESGRLAYEQ